MSRLSDDWRESAIGVVQDVMASQEFAHHDHERGQAGLIVDALLDRLGPVGDGTGKEPNHG